MLSYRTDLESQGCDKAICGVLVYWPKAPLPPSSEASEMTYSGGGGNKFEILLKFAEVPGVIRE